MKRSNLVIAILVIAVFFGGCAKEELNISEMQNTDEQIEKFAGQGDKAQQDTKWYYNGRKADKNEARLVWTQDYYITDCSPVSVTANQSTNLPFFYDNTTNPNYSYTVVVRERVPSRVPFRIVLIELGSGEIASTEYSTDEKSLTVCKSMLQTNKSAIFRIEHKNNDRTALRVEVFENTAYAALNGGRVEKIYGGFYSRFHWWTHPAVEAIVQISYGEYVNGSYISKGYYCPANPQNSAKPSVIGNFKLEPNKTYYYKAILVYDGHGYVETYRFTKSHSINNVNSLSL